MPRVNAALAREIQTIRASFHQLAKSFTNLAPHLTAIPEMVGNLGGASTRRKPRLSAAQRAALKLQGKYMGTMRGLSVQKRAQVKRVRARKGIKAAIRVAERLAS